MSLVIKDWFSGLVVETHTVHCQCSVIGLIAGEDLCYISFPSLSPHFL